MMDELFDEEYLRKQYDTAVRAEARKEGKIEGKKEGRRECALSTLSGLVNEGILSLSDAAKRANMSVEEFKKASANLTP